MKKSMRAVRMERHHKRNSGASLSLVSLMDIFTILVFFLLVNSSGVQQLPSSKSVKLPESQSQELPRENLIIMVSATDILVQGQKVADVAEVMQSSETQIEALKKNLMLQSAKLWDQKQLTTDEGAEITLLADKKIPYALLRKIMHTLKDTPFKKISLAVNKKTKEKHP